MRADPRLKVKSTGTTTRRRKSSGKRASMHTRDENAENDQRQAQRLLNEGRVMMNRDLHEE